MPLQDSVRLVYETKQSMIATKEYLEEAISVRDELTSEIVNARKRLKTKKNPVGYIDKFTKKTIKDMKAEKGLLSGILIGYIDLAVEKSDEFAHDVYKTALYKVASNNDIYKMYARGTGWNVFLVVDVVFEEEAGTLNDWARGISLYREEIKTKLDESLGPKATKAFLDKVWGTSLYTKTLKSRLDYSSREAPFWQLLNSGSTNLPSDRGGYNPFPQSPTAFIDDAERDIRRYFDSIIRSEKTIWDQETEEFENEIIFAAEIRDGFSEDIKRLRVEVKQNQAIFASLGKRRKYADEKKLAKAAQRLRAGEEFERVEITKKGSPKRVILSARQVEGFLDLDY